MKKATMLLLVFCGLLPLAKPASAQSLVPFRSEYRNQAKGQITLMNDKDVSVRVTLRPQSFTSDENGRLRLLPLDESVNLVLSQTSLRIPPKQTRYVSYEAKPKKAPAWFVIYASFAPEMDGFVIATSIPHFAYITGGDAKRDEVEMSAKYDGAKQLLRVSFVSHSQQIARVESVETSGGPKKDLGSLSVLPGKSTVLEVKLDGKNHPDSIKANLRKFKLQCPVVVE